MVEAKLYQVFTLQDKEAEIVKLKARIAELEARIAILKDTIIKLYQDSAYWSVTQDEDINQLVRDLISEDVAQALKARSAELEADHIGEEKLLAQNVEAVTLAEELAAENAKLRERPSILFPSLSCTFQLTNNYDDEFYETECGNSLVFFDGGPRENEYKYCPFCGKVIIVMKDDER